MAEEQVKIEGNGHTDEGDGDVREGLTLNLEDMIRPEAWFTRPLMQRNNSGVLRRLLDAVSDDKEYRQELKLGRFTSPRKAAQAPLAIRELAECGVSYTLIVDIICAQQAGVNQEYVRLIVEGLTHTTVTQNSNDFSKKRGGGSGKSNSPLAQ